MFYVYLVQSGINGECYVGSTNDLRKRLEEHNAGRSRSTARYRPWKLIYYEAYSNEKLARVRESKLKHHGNAIRELKKRIGLPSTTFRNESGAGFTLIELLIVLSIISVVAVAVLFSVANKLKQARDARRRSDLLEIRIGLEQYFGEQHSFPTSLQFNNQPLVGPAGQVYLPGVHPDPVNNDPYLFTYWASPSGSPQSYILCAYRLESQSGSFCVQNVE